MEFIKLEEVEQLAKGRMSKMAYDYYASGAETEQSTRDNREGFAHYRLLPRILRDVSKVDTSCMFLGRRIKMPVLVAPMAMHGLAHPGKELATARAAAAQGVPMCVSTMATSSIADVASVGHPFALFQLYVIRDRGLVEQWVREAERLGYKALVITVDAPRLGRREADERNRFKLPDGLELPNLAPLARRRYNELMQQQGSSSGSGGSGGDGSNPLAVLQARESSYGSGLFKLFASEVDDRLTWDIIPWLKSITSLPIFVKGVLSPEDAKLAVQHGAHGIIISNHGGRQLDYSPTALDMLPAVVVAVRGCRSQGCAPQACGGVQGSAHVPVLMDGGIRRGTDVVKALALGADAVLLGRPVLYGLALGGQAGVEKVLSILHKELELAMALCGATSVREIGPRLLLKVGRGLEAVGTAAGEDGADEGARCVARSRL